MSFSTDRQTVDVINPAFVNGFLRGDRGIFLQFLLDCGFLKSGFVCNKCSSDLKLKQKMIYDGLVWVCCKYVNRKECCQCSLRFGSWFACS